MKRFLILASLLLYGYVCEAALINRTYTYTDGNTITANQNNTNENTLYNEINGNISTANILDATILVGDLADTQITRAKLASTVQSTFTWVDTFGSYRRPVLTWISVTTLDIENNTGTSNQTCVEFPDERRCVTENTGSTSVNRRFIITEAASFTGTKNSGLKSGYIEAANTWYAVYAVKATDVATDFVLVGDTVTPTQANYAALNTAYGTSSWVYLGMIRNGDNSAATSDILKFSQAGGVTMFRNACADGNTTTQAGLVLAIGAAATTLTYTYSAGTGASNIPSHLTHAYYAGTVNVGSTGNTLMQDASATYTASNISNQSGVVTHNRWAAAAEGVKTTGPANSNHSVFILGFMDGVLGVGFNPQL